MARTDAKRKTTVLLNYDNAVLLKHTLTFVVQILITWRISNLCRVTDNYE